MAYWPLVFRILCFERRKRPIGRCADASVSYIRVRANGPDSVRSGADVTRLAGARGCSELFTRSDRLQRQRTVSMATGEAGSEKVLMAAMMTVRGGRQVSRRPVPQTPPAWDTRSVSGQQLPVCDTLECSFHGALLQLGANRHTSSTTLGVPA